MKKFYKKKVLQKKVLQKKVLQKIFQTSFSIKFSGNHIIIAIALYSLTIKLNYMIPYKSKCQLIFKKQLTLIYLQPKFRHLLKMKLN